MSSAREKFEAAWRRGENPRVEDFVPASDWSDPVDYFTALKDLFVSELELRHAAGERIVKQDFAGRFPQQPGLVDAAFRDLRDLALGGDAEEPLWPDMLPSGVEPSSPGATISLHPSQSNKRIKFGRYTIERELGRGGMGRVFLAHDEQLDRHVALKVPSFGGEGDDEAVERFYREARAMATVHHPNLCPVYDVGQIDGRHFLTMAYIEGESLATYLRRNQRMPATQAAELCRKVASALEKAHHAGIIHRDLKPRNIMLSPDGEPIIMDFGLARRNKAGEAELTHTGVVLGSPAYMAPEQVESRHVDVGPVTDIWALGVMFYQMVAGRRPFEGTVPAVLGQILSRDPDPPSKFVPELKPAVDAICRKAMAKDINRRHQSAREFGEHLNEVLNVGGVERSSRLNVSTVSASEHEVQTGAGEMGSATRRRREAELRQVTVAVFNFDPSRGAEHDTESQLVVSKAFAAFIAGNVKKFGGTVLAGNSQEVLACFGFPMAYEDAARRAVQSALHTLGEVSFSGESKLPRPEDMWVAIHTGEVIAEDTGLESGISLVGDARHTAQRLDAVAEPGTVVISGSTQKHVRLFFECESLGERRLRGVSQPIELFRVTKETSSRNKVELIDPGNLTPLIGRDTELRILEDRWEQTLEELGQVVLLIGDAGLGKSRLIRELRDRVAGASQEVEPAIIEFRCSQHHQNAGFFPAVEYLLRLLDLDRLTSDTDRLRRIERYLAGLKLASDENVALIAELLAVKLDAEHPALQLPPQRKKELLIELLRTWLRELAERRPVLFIVEDLHWVDPSTLEMLGRLVEQYEPVRMLTILTFRSEFQTPWRSFPHQSQIALNRLTKRQVTEMMQRRLKRRDLPDAVLKQISERTDGVPLFIEEFANLLAETGSLDGVGDADTSQWARAIPATLQDLLVARLDRMDSNPEVAQLAAAIGREFSFALLAAASDLTERELVGELEKLVRAEILFQKGKFPDAQFIFKHALIQDSAYRSPLKKRRQQFHLRIATALESRFPEQIETRPDLLAHHFTEADVPDKAVVFWRRAGQRAQGMFANHEAIAHYRQGLTILATQPPSRQRDEMEMSMTAPMGVAMLAAKGYGNPEVGPVFARARELGESVNFAPALFYILWGSWAWRLVRSDLSICHELAARVMSLAEAMPDPGWRCEAYFLPAVNHFYAGDFVQSKQHAEAAAALFDPVRCAEHVAGTGQDVRAGALSYLALSQWSLGLEDEALTTARRAVEVSRSLNHPMSLAFALNHAAWVMSFAKRWDEVVRFADEAEALATQQGLALWVGMAQAERGAALIGQGRAADGVVLLQKGYEAFAGTGARNVVPRYLALLAAGQMALGRLDEAQQWLDRAFDYIRDFGGQHFHTETLRLRGDLILARDPQAVSEAAASYQQAIDDARRRRSPSWERRAAAALEQLSRTT